MLTKEQWNLRLGMYKSGMIDFDDIYSTIAEHCGEASNSSKPHVSGSLPPFGFVQSAQELRTWIANNDDITDADYDTCRRALNELTRVINDALKRQISS